MSKSPETSIQITSIVQSGEPMAASLARPEVKMLSGRHSIDRLRKCRGTTEILDGVARGCLHLNIVVQPSPHGDVANSDVAKFLVIVERLIDEGLVLGKLSEPLAMPLHDGRWMLLFYLFSTASREQLNLYMGGEFFIEEGTLGPEAWPVFDAGARPLNAMAASLASEKSDISGTQRVVIDVVKTKPCPHCEGSGEVADDYAIGQLVRGIRARQDWTLRKLAQKMGISAPYLVDLEHGRRRWTPRLRRLVEEVTDLSITESAHMNAMAAALMKSGLVSQEDLDRQERVARIKKERERKRQQHNARIAAERTNSEEETEAARKLIRDRAREVVKPLIEKRLRERAGEPTDRIGEAMLSAFVDAATELTVEGPLTGMLVEQLERELLQ